jgi:hypothetical protein
MENRFRVNVLWRGVERWKYCRTIERAIYLRNVGVEGGLSSIIFQKTERGYVPLTPQPPLNPNISPNVDQNNSRD